MDGLTVALIGCGRIAKRHAEILSSGDMDGVRLGPVADIVPERAERFGREYGVSHYTDYHDMLCSHSDVDIIAVLTPSGLHAEHVLDVVEYGKDILVEKPMALRLDDADEMIKQCDIHGNRLFVVKQNRFNRPIVKLRDAVEHGRFGKLVLGTVRVRWCRRQEYYDQDAWRGTWALDGGVLANQASHHIDLLEWMMGEVDSVFALSRTALVDIEAEDTAVVVLEFASGALGVIEATTATRPTDLEGSISILGERGSVEVGGFAVNEMKVWSFEDEQPGDAEVMSEYSTNPPDVYGFGHRSYYAHVVDCINNSKQHLVDGVQGRKSLELIAAIYESIETGKKVHMRFRPSRYRIGTG